MLIVSFWMPDSPRWLVYVERNDEALVILQKLHQSTEDDDFYLREFHQIKAQIDLDKHEKLGMSAIWKRPSYRRRFLLVFSYAIACM
jgi:Sugar (and other) transporter